MRRKQLIDGINELLTRLVYEQETYLRRGLTDTSQILEDVMLPVFQVVYGYANIRNLNRDRPNFPAVDLGDDSARVGIQVTATRDRTKILDTLRTFADERLYERFDRLRIYILTTKQRSYSPNGIDDIIQGRFRFSVAEDILDYTDLFGRVCQLDTDTIERVFRILESNVGHVGKPTRVLDPGAIPVVSIRRAVDAVAREKNRRRYLPDVYSEVAEAKDKVRCFCYPTLFTEKAAEDLRRLCVGQVNRYLRMISVAPLRIDIPDAEDAGSDDPVPQCQAILDAIRSATAYLLPFCRETADPPPMLVPEKAHRVYREVCIYLALASRRLVREMEKLADDLRAAQSRVFLIVGRAGQGKTSFVCDLVERSLLPRSSPVLLLSGEELNRPGPRDIGQHIVREIWRDEQSVSVADGLSAIESFCAIHQVPFVVIIDGLNEVADYVAFRDHLRRFIGTALGYPHIRLLLTCRSEYFDQRFRPLTYESFADRLYLLDGFDERMSTGHREAMVRDYLRFFRLQPTTISGHVHELLSQDTILLRVFCEAYGNPEDIEYKTLPPLVDINRGEVFRLYLNRKLGEPSRRRSAISGMTLGVRAIYQEALAAIVDHMLATKRFTSVPIVGLDARHYPAIEDMLSEDLVLRKDLDVSVLDAQQEVISFTFDEFRDSLLADHLVKNELPRGTSEFSALVDDLVQPYSPVAEGIKRYLFYTSKHVHSPELQEILVNKPWYDEVFLDCIFSVDEGRTSDEDVKRLKELFYSAAVDPSAIVVPLTLRWDQRYFRRLSAELLLRMSAYLSPDATDRRIRGVFSVRPVNRVLSHGSVGVGTLASYAKRRLSDSAGVPGLEHLMEFLVLLLDLPSENGMLPSRDVFHEYASVAPQTALTILSRYVSHPHRRIALPAALMLRDLVRGGTLDLSAVLDVSDRLSEDCEAPSDTCEAIRRILCVASLSSQQPAEESLKGRAATRPTAPATSPPIIQIPDERGLHDRFLAVLETRVNRSDFLDAVRVIPGTYACDLLDRLYDSVFVNAADVQRELHRYYSQEYYDLKRYLFCRYNVPERVLDQVPELSPDVYVGYVDDRTGLLSIPLAMGIVNQVLESGTSSP